MYLILSNIRIFLGEGGGGGGAGCPRLALAMHASPARQDGRLTTAVTHAKTGVGMPQDSFLFGRGRRLPDRRTQR